MRRSALLALMFAAIGCAQAAVAADDKIDYSRDIRPILSRNCWLCHGPDADTREAELRLDERDAAIEPATSGQAAIVPGRPDDSELIRRILSSDEGERMPPPATKRVLSERERQLLRDWIAQGAEYAPHWAFLPPARPELPAVAHQAWPREELDRLVLARLEGQGLEPAPEAARETLIRRVSFDLTGLPPTPEEVDAFVADTAPDAYERLVERLLASPHYGERWARWWLDLARYADTNGYEKDRPRTIWPYRDWVIAAFNRDLPFNQFAIEQIAGDLLPQATADQVIATGFHRNTMINEEGGIDVAEFRFKAVVDRVQTTSAALLGLTLQCTQCHNHKYDPFTQREFYGLFALLNNADEVDFDVPDARIEQERSVALARIADYEARREALFPRAAKGTVGGSGPNAYLDERFARWQVEQAPRAGHWVAVRPVALRSRNGATLDLLDDDSIWVHGDCPNYDTYELELEVPLDRLTALRVEALSDPRLPGGGPGRAPLFSVGDFLLSEVQLDELAGEPATAVRLAGATHDFAAEKRAADLCLDGQLDTGWSIAGQTGEGHRAVFPLAAPLDAARSRRLRLTLVQQYIHQMTLGRLRIWATSDAMPVAANELPAEIETALAAPAEGRTAQQQAALREYFLATAPELAEHNRQIAELKRKLPSPVQTMVMQERAPQARRITHRHHRGEYLDPREVVEPGVPAALHPLPAGVEPNRLALARWLVDERNPLVARVTMNRVWAALFGRGIVSTIEDFGAMGERPSHPELLDWLATEFMRRGWSLKAMHRAIVGSAVYRQSSQVSPALLRLDPQNVLLARGPRLRLEAEMIRDAALTTAGLLDQRIGGPSVFPPQPAGISELSYGATEWPTSQGADRFRRGLYTYLKRTSPYPGLTVFDAPTADVTCPRRTRTNTPLQALNLLNDQVSFEAAQALARRVVTERADTPGERAERAFRLCLGRRPAADELDRLAAFYDAQLARLKAGELDAELLTRAPGLPELTDAPLDRLELAAWTTVARVLLNLDETITKE
ncbi:MAG: PSD1 and planctomycete cytochrome C domain-containing protein [Pirellulales bacterium]|nr:PSD1 and planctomycete cytochrome C domain-containing protein [Pirellulales bacterium]